MYGEVEIMRLRIVSIALIILFVANTIYTAPQPVRASRGMVTSQNLIASKIGANVLKKGGSAIDSAVSMAFALAVTHPTAGNIGGGGFIVYRAASGDAVAYDFREVAPLRSRMGSMILHNTISAICPLVSLVQWPVCISLGRNMANYHGKIWFNQRLLWHATGLKFRWGYLVR